MDKDDDSEFASLIPGVKRLHNDRVNHYAQRKHGEPQLRRSAANEYRHSPAQPSGPASALATHFNSGLQKKLQRRIRQGLIRPEASLDLHGYRQAEAHAALDAFLADASARGQRMLIIVHGQGYRSVGEAVLKPLVQRWLAQQPSVLAWCPAQPRDGGGGASYVYLRTA